MKKTLPAVLTSLSGEASERKDADAHGLHDFSFEFYSDFYEAYLQMLTDCIVERFPISNIVEAVGLFDLAHSESVGDLESGKVSLFELYSYLQNDPSLSFDLTTTESEWAVLFNELNTEYAAKQRASRKCSEVMIEVMNDERMFLTLSKIAKIGLILPVNTAACERGFS